MNKEEAIQKLKEIVKPYVKNEEALANINEDTDFINDLNINSANLVDVILDVEEVFDIEIDAERIPQKLVEKEINIAAKVSFGFGDVNGCIIFKKYS